MLLTGEAIFGTKTAIRKFGTKRRLRAHRRWDQKGGKVFEDNLGPTDLKIRWLSKEDNGKDTEDTTQSSNADRHRHPVRSLGT